ncbi:SDR family NAD(P)-dependent oxidoreductase [Blastococcus sp. URHD0036]|uniref:SDR family NAD(P)-dependent oxidoreductase n=1 Tax=Blastococcus sp. URHD0036 TaxID=1380356 RepID=UPI0004953D74|nr:SDR family NAD(P)-dependent oxidoreductase [Blastococcus sp. URHD0036]
MDLTGASALVVGGAGGFGEQTVRKYAAEGLKVVIADVAEEKANAIAAELGENVVFVHTDVTSDESVDAAIAKAQSLGTLRVTVIVNGGPGGGAAQRIVSRDGKPMPMEAFLQTTEYYYTATYRVLSRAAASMQGNEPLEDNQRGVVIMTASIAGFEAAPGQTSYAMAKGGVIALTLAAARDLAPAGIRVMGIAPGTFLTPAFPDPVKADETFGKMVLNPKRMGRPAEYAKLAYQIAENDYLNGYVIRLDGGLRFGA